MVFRLPTHLDTFVPPPSEQRIQPSPWRGSLLVSGLRAYDKAAYQEIWVTAIEVEGESQSATWPPQFFANLTLHRTVLKDVVSWLGRNSMPNCVFMPDRIRDPTQNSANQANFRSLATLMVENGMVAVASWNSERIQGAGIILYPAPNSTASLQCAVFFNTSFPEFLLLPSTHGMTPPRPVATQPGPAQSPASAPYNSSRYPHMSPQSPVYVPTSSSQHPYQWPDKRGA